MSELMHGARRLEWTVDNPAPAGGTLVLRGWDFGGEGPVALLHHANGMCAAVWAPVAVQLRNHYRVIALDARGHGDSQHLSVPDDYAWSSFVADCGAVAQQVLSYTNASCIALGLGSSFGGIVTAAAAAAQSGLFERIVMLDPPIHPTAELLDALGVDLELSPFRQEELVAQTLRRRDVWPSREAARAAWRDKPLFAPWQDEAFELYLAQGMADTPDGEVVLKCPPAVEAHIFATTGSLGVFEYAPHVEVPVLFTHARDGHFPESFARAVSGVFPAGEYAQLPAGHMLPLEVPDAVAKLVTDWAQPGR